MYNNSYIYIYLFITILAHCQCANDTVTTPINYPTIRSYTAIDSVLNSFTQVSFDQLPEAYKDTVGYTSSTLKKQLKNKPFYLIEGGDLNKKLVGDFTVDHFISKDEQYLTLFFSSGSTSYSFLTIDRKLLYKILDLQYELEKQGYDHNAFFINFGHRSPQCNELVGGAHGSRHMRGEAVDIIIEDIDKNGVIEQADKTIVLDIVEHQLIKDKGGVGRYPGSMVIHFDTRGYKARWNHQK